MAVALNISLLSYGYFEGIYQDGAGRFFRGDGPWLCSLHWEIRLERLPFSDGGFELVGDPGGATIEFVRGHVLGTIVCGPEYQAPARIHPGRRFLYLRTAGSGRKQRHRP
jgi:hypothetical protein